MSNSLDQIRHSASHVLATAVLRLFPQTKLDIGPATTTGFYYDFDLDHKFTAEDLEKLEAEMKKIIAEDQKFVRSEVSRDEAKKLISGRKQDAFKLERLEDVPEGEKISFYQNGDFLDLCAGPHVASTKEIGAVKLLSVAGAYHKGDEHNKQLQRIYGTAFGTQKELDEYLAQIEEAKKRDHRKLGKEMNLFVIDDDVGQGLTLWAPRGATIRGALEGFIKAELQKQGYDMVYTPHIGKLKLFKTSGHFPYYKAAQFPAILDREQVDKVIGEGLSFAETTRRMEGVSQSFANELNERTGMQMITPDRVIPDGELLDGFLLKPMNCPFHIKIYDSVPRSYRDLPLRLAEFGAVYRWEQSGELNGLTRVRGFTQDDAHIFCTEEQLSDEIQGCLSLVKIVLGTLGMSHYRVRVGLRDPDSHKYTGKSEDWDKAEAACRKAASSLGVPFTEEAGEAAFYGPKIDFVVKDVIGREWQLGTIQVDYNLPTRFNVSYTGADNLKHCPVMIHRAPFGSLERFTAIVIEHFGGNFPAWLAPEQVRLITITDSQRTYADALYAKLKAAGIRASVDDSSDKLGGKIRRAETERVPYMWVLGAKEAESGQVAVRCRITKEHDQKTISIDEAVAMVSEAIANKTLPDANK
jgi:threonyl-tRNA synthetase